MNGGHDTFVPFHKCLIYNNRISTIVLQRNTQRSLKTKAFHDAFTTKKKEKRKNNKNNLQILNVCDWLSNHGGLGSCGRIFVQGPQVYKIFLVPLSRSLFLLIMFLTRPLTFFVSCTNGCFT